MFEVVWIAGYAFVRKLLPQYYERSFMTNKQIRSLTVVGHIMTFRDFLFGAKHTNHNGSQLDKTIRIITQADELFVEEKHYEAYQLLNTVFNRFNTDVLWRISRVLFSIASNEVLSYNARKDLIVEAYHLVLQAEERTKTNFEIYKWLAILIKAKSDFGAMHEKLNEISKIKHYLTAALELNPIDITVLYLLGHWHYQLASLTWFQKKLATIFYKIKIPEASFKEAYDYFTKIEALKPNYFIMNTYMLAKSSYRIKNYKEAGYYFDIVEVLTYRTSFERRCMDKIRKNYSVNL